MREIFDMQPQFGPRTNAPEPTLRSIITGHYAKAHDPKEAARLAEDYIAGVLRMCSPMNYRCRR